MGKVYNLNSNKCMLDKGQSVRNRLALVCVCVIIAMLFAGCGRSRRDEYTYVPTFNAISGDWDRVSSSIAVGDKVYLFGSKMDEETWEPFANYFGVFDMNTLEYTDLSDSIKTVTYMNDMKLFSDTSILMNYNDKDYMQKLAIYDCSSNRIVRNISIPDLGIINEEMGMWLDQLVPDGQGNLYMTCGDQKLYVLNEELVLKSTIPLSEDVIGLYPSKEGDIYVEVMGVDKTSLKKVDTAAGTTTPVGFETPAFWGGKGQIASTASTIITTYENLYALDFQAGTVEELFRWVDINARRDEVGGVGQLSNGDYYVITSSQDSKLGNETSVIRVQKMLISEAPQMDRISFGCLYMSSEMERQIVKFNKTHGDIHIDVKEYMNLTDYSDQAIQDALNKFNSDMVSGESVDIIDLSTIPFDRYADKGLFVNLLPYMEESGMSEDDFLANVMGKYKVGDGIYAVLPTFAISSIAVADSRFPDRSGWNMEEFMNTFKDTPAEELTDLNNLDYYLSLTLFSDLDSFIDWDTGRCEFSKQEFFDILDYSKGFAADEYLYDWETSTFDKIKSGKVNIVNMYMYNVEDYQYFNEMFDHDLKVIGYPSENGTGSRFVASGDTSALAISSQSKHKDAAWEFLSTFIDEEFQDRIATEGMYAGFPIRKSSLQKMYEKAMSPRTFVNWEGVEEPEQHGGYYDMDIERPFYEASQEDIDAVNSIIENAEPEPFRDETVINIINEEKESYYSGDKTAEEVADIIENRLGIYVAENI